MPSISDYLGPANARYFGDGYGRVRQRFSLPRVFEDVLFGEIKLSYPDDWSKRRAGVILTPHLTSIDAILIAIDTACAYSIACLGLHPDQVRDCHVLEVRLRASGAPDTVTEPVQYSVRYTGEPRQPSRTGEFRCAIGSMRADIKLSYPCPVTPRELDLECSCVWLVGRSGTGAVVPADRTNLLRPLDVNINIEHMSASCMTARETEVSAARAQVGGPGSTHSSLATIIDNLVVSSQLAQALLLEHLGQKRESTGTLWMRRAAFEAPTNSPFEEHVQITLSPVRFIGRNGPLWATSDVTLSGADGVKGSASLALTLQD